MKTEAYLAGYAADTDRRVQRDPQKAIGGFWEQLGRLQFAYLVSQGLRPHHKLLDLGCGTLRGGRHFIRYLDPDKYTGTDISGGAIDYARTLVQEEQLAHKKPRLIHRKVGDGFFSDVDRPDYILAQSVFTHLPSDMIRKCFSEASAFLRANTIFYFTFKPSLISWQRGYKSFSHPPRLFRRLARECGYRIEFPADYPHPRGQRMAKLTA